MSDARSDILARVRATRAPNRDTRSAAARLERHPRNLIPDRAGRDADTNRTLFIKMVKSVAGTVERVERSAEVPKAVAAYLARHNLGGQVAMSPDIRLKAIPWASQPLLEIREGAAQETDRVAVTGTFAAIAETGTLLMASFADRPNTLNFLPDNHIVVVSMKDLIGNYEEAWDRLRAVGGLPRTCAFITGPSRTSDIELVPTLGAHGPRRLHVILTDD